MGCVTSSVQNSHTELSRPVPVPTTPQLLPVANLNPETSAKQHENPASNGQKWPQPLVVSDDASTVNIVEESGNDLFETAARTYQQVKESNSIDFLDTAVQLFREAIAKHPTSSDAYLDLLHWSATALSTRFEMTNHQNDIDEAIQLLKQLLSLLPSSHPQRPTTICKLFVALSTRFKHTSRESDCDEAVILHRQVLGLPPPADLRDLDDLSTSLNILGRALLLRYRITRTQAHIDEAILIHREALDLPISNDRLHSKSLYHLSNAFAGRFEHTGQLSDLNEAIVLQRQLLNIQSSAHPRDLYDALSTLATSLSVRCTKTGAQGDNDEAILLYRQALDLQISPDPQRYKCINNFANTLVNRAKRKGRQGDLDEAIVMFRQGVSHLPLHHDDPSKEQRSGELSAEAGLEHDYLDNSFQRQVFVSEPAKSPGNLAPAPLVEQDDVDEIHSRFLNNFANALADRFSKTGEQRDLDEALSYARQALNLQPPSHPEQLATCLGNVAYVLSIQFERSGRLAELDEAILLLRRTLDLRSRSHNRQFELAGQQLSQDFPGFLSYSSETVHRNYTAFVEGPCQEKDGLNEAILKYEQILDHQLVTDPSRPMSLRSLAQALLMRFEQEGHRSDLNTAILSYREALDICPPIHPSQSQSYNNLGNLYISAHEKFGHLNPGYLEDAMASFSMALNCASQSTFMRFRAARTWSSKASEYHHHSALNAFNTALELLPQLAPLSFDIQSRHEALTAFSDGLARKAAQCAIRHGQLGKAIEFLELGRGIGWSRILQLRSPFDRLQESKPEVAAKLQDIALQLRQGSFRDVSANMSDNGRKMNLEQQTAHFEALNREWLKGLHDVRSIEGFDDFLLPPRISSLRAAAAEYPVAILIQDDNGLDSDCLVMWAAHIHHIHLPKLSTTILRSLIDLLDTSVDIYSTRVESPHPTGNAPGNSSDGVSPRYDSTSKSASYILTKEEDDFFNFVLSWLWHSVVKPVIRYLDFQKSEDPVQRLQWCPTGLFTFLPLHAAGSYGDNSLPVDVASQYIISSYTPTIGALLSQNPLPTTSDTAGPRNFEMMAVVDSRSLLSTREELQLIEERVPKDCLLVKLGAPGGPAASIEAVRKHLPTASIAHFACHGTQDKSNPLNSSLILDGDKLRISEIMKTPIPNGSLAFLCACQTATGDMQLPDEVINLGASLIFSGYRSVIATMWDMKDKDGPIIADAFYEELFRQDPDGNLFDPFDSSKSARALAVAVKKLQTQKGVEFRHWVPFIHMGK